MRIARLVAEVLAWWAVTFSVWMITLSAAPLQEYLLAAGCSLGCAATAFWSRRALGAVWARPSGWLRAFLALPVAAVTDSVQVFWAVVRPGQPGGRFHHLSTGALGASPDALSRRATATWLMSVTPGSYVLDSDSNTGLLMVHQLAGRGPRMEEQVEQ